jgi:hypothetical protein
LESSAFRIRPVGLKRIGFNLNASRNAWVTAVGVERIQDKTRWTKALGEAVTCVYGDCTEEIRRSRHSRTVGHENTGPSLMQRVVATGWENAIDSRPTRREVMKQVAPMRGLWHRALQAHRFLFVDRSSRRIPWCGDGQFRNEDQRSLLAERASSDIDTGEFEHQLVN